MEDEIKTEPGILKPIIKLEDADYAASTKYVSNIVIKDEIIIPDALPDDDESESTISDNEDIKEDKQKTCVVCSKYRSMFIILNNHECLTQDGDGQCEACTEISHWSDCFKNHKECHDFDGDDGSESTISDLEENEDTKCDICFKYQFMLVMLRRHECQSDKCEECEELAHWLSCFDSHKESHEEDQSDSTASDEEINEEDGKCEVCFKYQSMLAILRREHQCRVKTEAECEECDEISHWSSCWRKHRESHEDDEEWEVSATKCSICSRLNAMLLSLVQEHECDASELCKPCEEVNYWLACLKRHKDDPTDKRRTGGFVTSEGLDRHDKCNVCRKLSRILIGLASDHWCLRDNPAPDCPTCREMTYWSTCLNTHRIYHGVKDVLACGTCGKRFSGQRMLDIHRPYCEAAPFACDKCDRGFLNPLSLKKHKLSHSFHSDGFHENATTPDGKYLKCSQCPAQFRYKAVLKKHELAHTANTPFWCKLCGTRFKWFSSLMNHTLLSECPK